MRINLKRLKQVIKGINQTITERERTGENTGWPIIVLRDVRDYFTATLQFLKFTEPQAPARALLYVPSDMGLNGVALETLALMNQDMDLALQHGNSIMMHETSNAIVATLPRYLLTGELTTIASWTKIGHFNRRHYNNGDLRHCVRYIDNLPNALIEDVFLAQYHNDDLRFILQSNTLRYAELIDRMVSRGFAQPTIPVQHELDNVDENKTLRLV